jgi:hypothetical protein
MDLILRKCKKNNNLFGGVTIISTMNEGLDIRTF